MKKFLPALTFAVISSFSSPEMFATSDASLVGFGTTYAEPGQQYRFFAIVVNKGDEPISELTYKTIVNGDTENQFTVELAKPLGVKGQRYISLQALAPDELGVTVTLKLQLIAVNGEPVSNRTASGKVTTVAFAPIHKVAVEDYTGTWCQACPQGYVAMEGIRRDYEGEILGIAYHSSDPMATGQYAYPQQTNYVPTLRVNRNTNNANDTGSGSTAAATAIRVCNTPATAAVTMETAEWLDEEHSDAYGKATVEFGNLISANEFQIEFVLIEDGLTGSTSSWAQVNGFAGSTAPWNDELWSIFTSGTSAVTGLTFNDVCISNTLNSGSGFTAAIPSTPANTPITFEYTFAGVNQIKEKGSATKCILQHPEKCHIAAIVSSKSSKEIANVDWLPVAEKSGVTGIIADSSVSDSDAPKEFFNLQGVRVDADNVTPGIYIVKQGNRTSKVVIR